MMLRSEPVSLSCWLRWVLAAALFLTAPWSPAHAEDWKFDVLRLKNGKTFQGLVVAESPSEIRFQCVRRSPGSPTVVIFTTFQRGEIAGIDRLDERDREELAARLKALDPTGKGEIQRMEQLELKPATWIQQGQGEALSYRSDHFVLLSNAREDIVRRAAVRLEDIYAAYTRLLPPRRQTAKPTTIVLIRSLAEYQDYLRSQGRHILNPAFYDPAHNRILCASNLQRLGDELEQTRKHHQKLLEDLKQQEADWKQQYKGRIPQELRAQVRLVRQKIQETNKRNDEKFQEATRRLFQTLYHEAFHAYLANFVYAPGETEVPRWLNEGLAQIFESALVEAGELRVDHADKERLARFKAAADKGETVPLSELLQSGPKQFLVAHASDQQISDRFYLSSWALAFYLAFERRLLGTPALDKYVHALKRGVDPQQAFRDLVAEPLPEFEKEFRSYLLSLRPDGSIPKAPR